MTTNTMTIINLLADGKSRTVKQIARASGLNYDAVHNALTSLARHKMTIASPVQYELTPSGMKRAGWKPLTYEQRIARTTERQRIQNAEKKRDKELVMAAQKIVNGAHDAFAAQVIRNAPNSVFALGGMS